MTIKNKLFAYKILVFLFAFIVAFMPSTAVRNKEVNSRVIVEIIGLDGGADDKMKLTAQYVMPTGGKGETGKGTVTVDGDTLNEAVELLNTTLGRRAELGHCSVVIVGKTTDPKMLGTLMTATDVTADVWVAAAEDKAEDIIGDLCDFMQKSGATDAEFIAYGARKAHIATNTLLGFISDLNSASKTAYLPLVQMQSEKSEGGSGGSGGGSGDSGGSSGGSSGSSSGSASGGSGSGGEEKNGMTVEKLAVYTDSGRVGVLGSTAARGVAWVSARIEKGAVCADVELGGRTYKDVCGRLIKKQSSVHTDAKNGRATVKVKAYIEPRGDRYNELLALNDNGMHDAVSRGFCDAIEREVRSAYADSLVLNADPLFIGRQFYRYSPDFFSEQYVRGDVEVAYDIEIALK